MIIYVPQKSKNETFIDNSSENSKNSPALFDSSIKSGWGWKTTLLEFRNCWTNNHEILTTCRALCIGTKFEKRFKIIHLVYKSWVSKVQKCSNSLFPGNASSGHGNFKTFCRIIIIGIEYCP